MSKVTPGSVWGAVGLTLLVLLGPLVLAEPPEKVGTTPRAETERPEGTGAAIVTAIPPVETDPLPAELEDSDFNRFFDWRELGRVYATLEPARLTDLAIKLGNAERVLKRPHKAVPASRLFADAVEVASRQRDLETLGRLEATARAWGLPELQAGAATARQAAAARGSPRALPAPVDGATPDAVTLIRAFQTGIESASVLGDRDALEEYEQRIVVATRLPLASREALLRQISTALKGVPEASDVTARVLRDLTTASRVLTAAEYVAGRTAWLSPHSYFEETDPKVWFERQNTSQRQLRENARTRTYVELYDRARDRYVRLYNMKVFERLGSEQQWRVLWRGNWEDPVLLPLDQMKLPDIRGVVDRDSFRSFPYLGKRYEVLGPATRRYNCIAWSLHITDRWVWPGDRVSDFDRLNGRYGYRRLDKLDYVRRPFIDRIVLYGHRTQGRIQATHQARQLADSSWSSKLGGLPLIRHLKPEDVDGNVYGIPVAVYTRTRQHSARWLPDLHPFRAGE